MVWGRTTGPEGHNRCACHRSIPESGRTPNDYCFSQSNVASKGLFLCDVDRIPYEQGYEQRPQFEGPSGGVPLTKGHSVWRVHAWRGEATSSPPAAAAVLRRRRLVSEKQPSVAATKTRSTQSEWLHSLLALLATRGVLGRSSLPLLLGTGVFSGSVFLDLRVVCAKRSVNVFVAWFSPRVKIRGS